MKYIITESKLTNIIFDYLNDLDLYMVEDRGDYYFWESKESWNNNGYFVIYATHKRKDCFISSDLLVEVSSFFNLELEVALVIINKWVETKVGFGPLYPISDYGSD